MLSPKLRSKVYNLWTKFWSAGMTNPLTAIEQITYLIFLKQLEILDKERMEAGLPSIYGSRDFDNEKWYALTEGSKFKAGISST